MLKLQFVDKRQPSMWLVDERFTIGRDRNNSLVINDEGVSVFHAELRQEDGKLFLWDCGSVNGTFLNGERVKTKTEVKVGDLIRLYLVELQIIDPSKAPVELPQAVKRDIDRPAPPQWQLKALTGVLSGRMFLLDGTKIVGRDPGCDIAVTGAHVSRRHAELSLRAGQLWVKDLGSSNGSFVNGKRIEEGALRNGDELKFDAMTFRVVGPETVDESFADSDMTQFRPVAPLASVAPAVTPKPAPAGNVSAVAMAEPPRPVVAPAASAAPRPVAMPEPEPVATPSPAPVAEKKSGVNLLVVVLGLVVVAAVAAFVLLK